jgi:7,8-dihydro-6-hydroxymethylpterin dimethyltransferase
VLQGDGHGNLRDNEPPETGILPSHRPKGVTSIDNAEENGALIKNRIMNELTHIATTASVCPICLNRIDARIVSREGDIFLEKNCPDHGPFSTIIWRGAPSFDSWKRPKIPSFPARPATAVEKGCPFDCGLCPDHRQHTCTALLEVTQRCNLSCAFCFAESGNREDPGGSRIDPPLSLIRQWYESVRAYSGTVNIQISGGEPTMRADLPDIVSMGLDMGFGFIQLNTNGLLLGTRPGLAGELKQAGLSSVFLQFDGTTDEIYLKIRGEKLLDIKRKAIERCVAAGIGVVLVPTIVPGINDTDIGNLVNLAIHLSPGVRGVHFQPVSYFGRFPGSAGNESRITLPEVLRAIEQQTKGAMRTVHFNPPGCENALCSFHGNFLILKDGALMPLTPSSAGCCSPPEIAAEGAAKAVSITARHWAAPESAGSFLPLSPSGACCPGNCGPPGGPSAPLDLSEFVDRVKTHTLSISAMAFQDAWNLDLERLKDCCIHTVSPDGRLVPFCAYNLSSTSGIPLYRKK